ncbi:triphosphoribosyl-dephospho-CoA synthase CitG [Irregularibacter muris]|uniref:Probable 2-(5''-triphosphoribosyl)-3'-dephosphocoenzyme-A synthase n=1 Tax=Irregularibacter muris TaxID=1796619 RepID=A0AAE3HGU5_9FIRM|nr:triphosphoribosyl-dephospho-CoA synthase CitG [Irregularibacter muris]MCR1898828.1 triphosphoribosyl-dephospho-CoA synthase CitG [Irregularibacter muris]
MDKAFCTYVAYLAQKSVLYEVSATPKPGLVDRNNSGAHRDMDFFTFMSSGASLYEGFFRCTLQGMNFQGLDLSQLLGEIRSIGIEMEEKMFKSTRGINTHKGIIFSLGILCAAVGYLYQKEEKQNPKAERVCEVVAQMTKGITHTELENLKNKKQFTYGEKLFLQYGITGIRGEVESGFKTVRKKGIDLFRDLSSQDEIEINHILIQILLSIMTLCVDSNVISRQGIGGLEYVQKYARKIISQGGVFSKKGKEAIEVMDRDFIKRNISPGGSADLMAVTVFLGMLEDTGV